MRDDWKRIIELERRQRKNAYQLNSLERTVKAAKEKLKLVDQALPPTIISGGGGGGSNIIRWAKDFCMAVVFDTYPTIDAAYSENPTKDADSLEAAIHALETGIFIPPEILSTSGEYSSRYITGSHTVYYPTDSTMWQFMSIGFRYSSYVIEEIRSPHLRDVGGAFTCGWFPTESAIVQSSLEDPDDILDVTKKYVPGVSPFRSRYASGSYTSVADLPSWDAFGTVLYSAEAYGGTSEDPTNFTPYGSYLLGSDPDNTLSRITKFVEFWTYDDEGLKRSLKTLAYHHSPYEHADIEGDDIRYVTGIREPYKYTSGPKRGTTGSYLIPAIGAQYKATNDTTTNVIDTFGTAELFVSWGSTCEDAVPPITDDTPDDWEDFCAAITAASATFLKIPGLTIKFNGTELFGESLGTYSTQPTISFEFAPRLKDFLDANPDVVLRYEFACRCDDGGPFSPITQADYINDGFSFIPPRNTTCDGRDSVTENFLQVIMEAEPPRYMFEDECCTPYANHCSVSSLETDQVVWYIDPP